MPYYCTVPCCTSMAGKAKNVSFHQFPKNEELAALWNTILKRGKPYTKYSKVCSLHFKPEDYTMTSVGKNKGQWRTLRKNAIPSQNLPPGSPSDVANQGGSTANTLLPNLMDTQMQQLLAQQQIAQAIFVHTMLSTIDPAASEGEKETDSVREGHLECMDLSVKREECEGSTDEDSDDSERQVTPHKPEMDTTELQSYLLQLNTAAISLNEPTSYQCDECSKCFKDPDVFMLHKRKHNKECPSQKENIDNNVCATDMLKANPILANLLRPEVSKVPTEELAAIAMKMNMASPANDLD